MTSRGRALLGVGLLTYVAARAFGSKPLYPVALGLLFLLVVAWLWVRLAQGPMRLHREIGAEERLEVLVLGQVRVDPLDRKGVLVGEVDALHADGR